MAGGVLAGFLLDWKLGQRGGKNKDKALDKKLQDDVAKLNKHLKLVIKNKQDVLQKILDAQQTAIGDLHSLVESAEDANVPRKDYAVVLEVSAAACMLFWEFVCNFVDFFAELYWPVTGACVSSPLISYTAA